MLNHCRSEHAFDSPSSDIESSRIGDDYLASKHPQHSNSTLSVLVSGTAMGIDTLILPIQVGRLWVLNSPPNRCHYR